MIKNLTFYTLIILFLLIPFQSYAYLGPGIAGGVLLATVGIVIAIIASILGLILYFFRKVFKQRKKNNQDLEKIDK